MVLQPVDNSVSALGMHIPLRYRSDATRQAAQHWPQKRFSHCCTPRQSRRQPPVAPGGVRSPPARRPAEVFHGPLLPWGCCQPGLHTTYRVCFTRNACHHMWWFDSRAGLYHEGIQSDWGFGKVSLSTACPPVEELRAWPMLRPGPDMPPPPPNPAAAPYAGGLSGGGCGRPGWICGSTGCCHCCGCNAASWAYIGWPYAAYCCCCGCCSSWAYCAGGACRGCCHNCCCSCGPPAKPACSECYVPANQL
jgi:hypothetical protein